MIFHDPFFEKILVQAWQTHADPAHDLGHIRRVVSNARIIAVLEGGKADIVVPAAWLHDIVNLPKDHPQRSQASTLAADEAVRCLEDAGYPPQYLPAIHHAIRAHSFSAGVAPETLEAKILQDADRLDALGAIGIARCFAVGGALGRALFDPQDPLAENRVPDDTAFTLDHFAVKLYAVADGLHTNAARGMAEPRIRIMRDFASHILEEARS